MVRLASLRRRVLLIQVMGFALTWFTLISIHIWAGSKFSNRISTGIARDLADVAEGDDRPTAFQAFADRWEDLHGRYQVQDARGNLLWHSPSAPIAPFPIHPETVERITLNRGEWIVASARSGKGNYIAAYAKPASYPLISSLKVSIPLLILLILASIPGMLFLLISLRHALKPLNHLATLVAGEYPKDLTPLDPPVVLRETQPLLDEFNRLMRRLKEALHLQTRFLADAAHELRTP